MRVTNDTLRQVFLNALEIAQRRVQDTQAQVSTGLRIQQPSDDPVSAARIRELETSLSRLDQYEANGIIAQNRLALGEEVLTSVVDNLQRVRELAIQANNATQGAESHRAINIELRERLESLISLANSTDSSGRYMFSGFAEDVLPFAQSGTSIVYNGDQGQRMLQVSDSRFIAVTDSGSEVFQRIPNGNGTFALEVGASNTGTGALGKGSVTDPTAYVPDTYTITFLTATDYEVRDGGGGLVVAGTYAEGDSIAFLGIDIELSGQPAAGDTFTATPSTSQDLFTTVQNLIETLDSGGDSGSARAILNSEVAQSLENLDQAIGRILEVRSETGSRLQALDEEAALNEGFGLQLVDTLSELRDLDYAEAISSLSQQLLGLEAAQQTFARVQGLSLFRYL
ncbi:MAG: flagellar hook-associated protein FlgL [Gammaproteobacteria bacterium]